MDVKNCYEGIDKYAVWLVRRRARYLVGKAGFTEDDREDLEQEMIIDLLRRLPQFNSSRAQRKTFIAKVIPLSMPKKPVSGITASVTVL